MPAQELHPNIYKQAPTERNAIELIAVVLLNITPACANATPPLYSCLVRQSTEPNAMRKGRNEAWWRQGRALQQLIEVHWRLNGKNIAASDSVII